MNVKYLEPISTSTAVTEKLTGIITQSELSGNVSTCIAVRTKLIKAKGKRNFQENDMSWSILTRGRVARVHIITKNTMNTLPTNQSPAGNIGPRQPPRKRVVITDERARASAYSAR